MIDPLPLGWPYVIFQPIHQTYVVGHPAKQTHCGMCVGIDQTRDQNVVWALRVLCIGISIQCLVDCANVYNFIVTGYQCMIFEQGHFFVNGGNPRR
jgi:hypothetical protein